MENKIEQDQEKETDQMDHNQTDQKQSFGKQAEENQAQEGQTKEHTLQDADAAGEADASEKSSGDALTEDDGFEQADSQDGTADGESGPSGEKKGFFKKNKKKDKKDKKDEKIEELTDQVKRQMAEFDNFRKRTEKEKTQMYEIGAKSIIEKVLPVVDNFERGLVAVPQDLKDDAFVDGMNKIYKQLMTMLEEADVKPIEAVGKEFDPNLHNAVMQTESEEYESGIVAQELQKGYTYRDSVVRHSMVAVVS